MKPKIRASFLIFLALFLVRPVHAADAKAHGEAVPQYGLFEWSEPVEGHFKNPFDPDEVEFSARVIAPDGTETLVPGFYCQDYEQGHATELVKKGEPQWRVRFSPPSTGIYRFTTTLKTRAASKTSPERRFTAGPGDPRGFIRNDSPNRLFFRTDSGQPYFPLGIAVAWTSQDRLLLDYRDYFDKMKAGGCNFTRVWNCEWNMPLEWTSHPSGREDETGLGRYIQESSWQLDRVLKMAVERDIRVLLTLGNYGELMTEKGPWGEQSWDRNPYNKKNGGPCKKPWDFFTDKKARKLFRQRLRYVAARWGWCTHLFACELFNEVKVPPEWAREMADAFRQADPNRHLVADSVGFPWDQAYDEDALWSLPGIGYSQSHYYGSGAGQGDLAELVFERSNRMARKFQKPFFFEELGLDAMLDDLKVDQAGRGTHLHNALWASSVCLSAGAPLSHWKEYVDRHGLYREYSRVRPFLDAVDRGTGDWEPFSLETPVPDTGPASDLVLACGGQWGEKGGESITASPDGNLEGNPNKYLRTVTRDGQVAPVLHVLVPKGCRMVLHVDQVSTGADLHVLADGREVWHKVFDPSPAPGGDGEYRNTALSQYGVYFGDYRKDYAFDLPEGAREIKLENRGRDWISLKSLTLTKYLRGSRIKLYGMRTKDTVIAWVQDKKDVWGLQYREGAVEPPMRKGVRFALEGLVGGPWSLEWWDPYSGKASPKKAVTVGGGALRLSLPPFRKDVAFILRRAKVDSRR